MNLLKVFLCTHVIKTSTWLLRMNVRIVMMMLHKQKET